jgi:HD-GYP domain-containing protein (c-di-GMP phosphodiesterase class II)
MLKRINRDQLRVGMFVEAFEGPSFDSRLQSRRFLLQSSSELIDLKQSSASGICINLSKGVDVHAEGAGSDTNANKAKNPVATRQHALIGQRIRASSVLLKSIFSDIAAGTDVTVEMVAPVVEEVTEALAIDPKIFISMTRLKTRDQATFLHCLAVSALMIRFATVLRRDAHTVSVLGISGLLHDLGKIGMPLDILTKAGPLTDEEMQHVRRHPLIGFEIMSRIGGMPDVVLDVCLHHHERLDGKGYPFGLVDEQIGLYARMAAICDVYDALTSIRPYKRPWSSREAVSWMLETNGIFDPDLLNQFVENVV